MVEHAARGARSSGVMISKGSIVLGIVFVLLFALVLAFQVKDLGTEERTQQPGHEHGDEEEEEAGDEAPEVPEDVVDRPPPTPGETQSVLSRMNAATADQCWAEFDLDQCAQWADADPNTLTKEQLTLVTYYEWYQRLLADDINTRIDGGLHLREMPEGWSFLRIALGDGRPEVRRAAANSLAFCPWPDIAPELEELVLAEPDPDTREALALAVGSGGRSPSSLPVLQQILDDDPDPAVRKAAAVAIADLAAIGVKETVPHLVRASAREYPGPVRGEALEGIFDLVKQALSEASPITLADIDTPEVGLALQEALQDPASSRARLYAVRSLRALGRSEAWEDMLRLIDDDNEADWQVRHYAARALGEYFEGTFATNRDDETLRRVVARLLKVNVEDSDPVVQFAASAALRDIGYDPGKWRPYEEQSDSAV